MSESETRSGEIKPRAEDVASPEAIIKAMYETISGPAGKRNWYRERSLYLPGARLIPIGRRIHGEGGLHVMNVDEWIEEVTPFFAENDFWEMEVMRHADRFGNMIQAFSTYEARDSKDGPPIARGINSIQLMNDGGRWWVVQIYWLAETEELPLPSKFLPGH